MIGVWRDTVTRSDPQLISTLELGCVRSVNSNRVPLHIGTHHEYETDVEARATMSHRRGSDSVEIVSKIVTDKIIPYVINSAGCCTV